MLVHTTTVIYPRPAVVSTWDRSQVDQAGVPGAIDAGPSDYSLTPLSPSLRDRLDANPVASPHAQAHHPIMFHFTCPGCAAHIAVADAARIGEPCGICVAGQTWASMQAEDQRRIDAAIRRGSIAGLLAMRDVNPPILLPHAADLLAFRQQACAQIHVEPECREATA